MSKVDAKQTRAKNKEKNVGVSPEVNRTVVPNRFTKLVDRIVMRLMSSDKTNLLLAGEPGTGKTSMVQDALSLLRIRTTTVEAPHTSEEHLINMPYLVKTSGSDNSYSVVTADSHLVSILEDQEPLSDEEYNDFLDKNPHLKPLAKKYEKIAEQVPCKSVLFLDEFYRTGSKRMQNLFRTILNGRIGNTKIPKNIGTIFASNMDNKDGSLDEVAQNHQFFRLDFDSPTPLEFANYIHEKYLSEEGLRSIRQDVFDKIITQIGEDDLGEVPCAEGGDSVRLSPRRWEEMAKYISASLPVKDAGEGSALLTYLYVNFKDYKTDNIARNFKKFYDAGVDLIASASGINKEELSTLGAESWTVCLKQQIAASQKMGKSRRYSPVVSGAPGIGKTAMITQMSKELGMKTIGVDASTLNSEDVIGLATGQEDEDGDMSTSFSTPPLLNFIMDIYDPTLKTKTNEPYTHVLFIDELSRTNKKVFNAIRALMLEKRIGSYGIPDDILIVSAMNPVDIGATELTGHMQDVVDIYPAAADYGKVMEYVANSNPLKKHHETLGFDLGEILLPIHETIVELFKKDYNENGDAIDSFNARNFQWGTGLNSFYVSAREMDAMITSSVENSVNSLVLFEGFQKNGIYNEEDWERFTEIIANHVIAAYKEVLGFVMLDKNNISEADFDTVVAGVQEKVLDARKEIFNGFKTRKSTALTSMSSILTSIDYKIDTLLEMPEDQIQQILESVLDNNDENEFDVNEFIADISSIFDDSNLPSSAPLPRMYTTVQIWLLLKKIDWARYSFETSAQIGEIFANRGFSPAHEAILEDGSIELPTMLEQGTLKYAEEMMEIVGLINDGKNIFIKDSE